MTNAKRNIGIDWLRIISTMMIIALHLNLYGDLLGIKPILSKNYIAIWTVEVICYCAVNCYGLISGYVNFEKEWKIKRIINLYLQVIFYSIFFALIFKFLFPNMVSNKEIIASCFPVFFERYWYFTAYFALYFMIPYLNKLIHAMNQKEYQKLIAIFIIVFSIIPTMRTSDLFKTGYGYSPLWLMILYLIGAYMKKYPPKIKKSYKMITLIASIGLVLSSKLIFDFLGLKNTFWRKESQFLLQYSSPFILIIAIILLDLFSKIKRKENKIIYFFSKVSFAVYLIHNNPVIVKNFPYDWYKNRIEESLLFYIIYIVVATIMIYLICSIIEYIRAKGFEIIEKFWNKIKPTIKAEPKKENDQKKIKLTKLFEQ